MRSFSAARFRSLLVMSVFLSVAAPVSAAVKDIGLSQAIDLAIQNNGDLKSFREEKGIRTAGRLKAAVRPNPVLEFEGATGAVTGSPSDNSLSIGVSQEVLTAGKREKRVQAADLELEVFQWQLCDRERILSAEVRASFNDYLLSRKRAELAERSILLSRQLLQITKERLDAGDIPELEANLARVEVFRGEGKKTEAQREVEAARARLLSLLSLPWDEIPEFSGSLGTGVPLASRENLRTLAWEKRPDLRALAAERAKDEAEIVLARAEGVPNLTAGVFLKRESTSFEVGGLEGRSRDYQVGVRLSVPLPLFDKNRSGIIDAQARRGSAASRYLYARENVRREVDAAYANLDSAGRSVSIFSRDILPQIEENLKLVQEAYRLGEVGILSVIEEQKKFIEVNEGYLRALYDQETALAKLEAAVGTALRTQPRGGDK